MSRKETLDPLEEISQLLSDSPPAREAFTKFFSEGKAITDNSIWKVLEENGLAETFSLEEIPDRFFYKMRQDICDKYHDFCEFTLKMEKPLNI